MRHGVNRRPLRRHISTPNHRINFFHISSPSSKCPVAVLVYSLQHSTPISSPVLCPSSKCSRQLDPPSHEHTTSMQLAIRHSVWFWNRWADLSAVIFSWGSWAAARSGSPAGRTTCPCGLLRSCFHWIAYSVLSYLYSTCSRFLS